MANSTAQAESPVLHVVVIGFHHKKGSQVEYSYPPLIPGGDIHSNDTPPEWKNLPSLAVPDGAHNYTRDTIYFHLPARKGTFRTVFGVACYRQIDSSDLKNRTTDITRNSVQKSVCVLSYLPLYGLIQAKLELITHAYFQELDFSQVSLLEETYKNLNLSLTDSLLDGGSQVYLHVGMAVKQLKHKIEQLCNVILLERWVYLGMAVKQLVQQFKHKIVQLFKLILLERRVLFTGSPVEDLGNALLSVLSLFPGMIEHGLIECTTYGVHQKISPTMRNTNIGDEEEEFLEIRYSDGTSPELKLHGPVGRTSSYEPQSPTIERGAFTDYPGAAKHVQYNSARNAKRMLSLDGQTSELALVEDYYSERPGVHGSAKRRTKSVDVEDAKRAAGGSGVEQRPGETTQQILIDDSSVDMMGMMQYEAIQAGKTIPPNGSVINMEDFSQSIDMDEDHFANVSERATIGSAPGELSISLEDYNEGDSTTTKNVKQADSVEELDSPESINQIDREDCFSWEDDKLSLAIDTDKSSNQLDETAGLASSFKEPSLLERHGSSGSRGGRVKVDRMSSSESADCKELDSMDSGTIKDGQSTPGKTPSRDGSPGSAGSTPGMKAAAIKSRLTNAFSGLGIKQRLKNKAGSRDDGSEPPSPAVEARENVGEESETSTAPVEAGQKSKELPMLPVLQQDNLGLPLAVFTKGCVFFPYLSLQYYDILNDVNVRSFVIGATNMLFRQKRHLTDVIVDVNENKLEIHDRELQKILTLTTADLRFADILVKAVFGSSDEAYLYGTEWEGNDEWLRAQFRLYLESLLATTLTNDVKLQEDFGTLFIQTWKTTHNYRVWSSTEHPGMKDIITGHPCQGNLGMADIKVRLSHTMQNTEGGKKINAAVTQTGKYVVQTGKAVGGALTSAKSSLSSWFTSFTSDWKTTNLDGKMEPTATPATTKPTADNTNTNVEEEQTPTVSDTEGTGSTQKDKQNDGDGEQK